MTTIPPPKAAAATGARLERRLGAWNCALLTIGSVVGTGIFLTPRDVARALHDPWLVIAVTVVAGLFTLVGALTYAELGVMFPRAGGLYVFLKEAYGPAWAFLYGWAAFLVIMSGGVAAIAMGFAQCAATFVPWCAPDHVLASVHLGGRLWQPAAPAVAATVAIVVLTAVNHLGLRAGATLQAGLTLAAVIAVTALALFAAVHGATALHSPALAPPPPNGDALGSGLRLGGGALAGLGVAMVAMLWTYDGWYGLTFSAGEVRRPERDIPRGLILGTVSVIVLYTIAMAAYVRVLPMALLIDAPNAAEATAAMLGGARAARLASAVVVVCTLGCLAGTILYGSRTYVAMAEDGLFFAPMARVHPRFHTPTAALWAQSAWACVLVWSGTYAQLYTYVTVVVILFHFATTVAVFVLRRRAPDHSRPYHVWGYPVVPALFALACLLLLGSALHDAPRQSITGLVCVAAGLPALRLWQRKKPG